MTAIISLIAVAVLSLSAGFFVLSTGRRKPESGKPADHKLNIRKAPNLAIQEVNDDPPEGLSDLEGAALLLEERDPMDIYLDKSLPEKVREEAGGQLIWAGFTFHRKKPIRKTPKKTKRNDCGVDKTENTATDEELVNPLTLTGD